MNGRAGRRRRVIDGWCSSGMARGLGLLLSAAPIAAGAAGQITIDDVQFGWNKVALSERWMPVTLKVTGGPAGFSGVVRIEFAQDATQHSIVTAAIAATPNTSSTVVVPIRPAASMDPIEVSVIGADGEKFRSVYSPLPTSSEKDLELRKIPGGSMVLIAGEASAVELTRMPREETDSQQTGVNGPFGSTTYYLGEFEDNNQGDTPKRRVMRWKRTLFHPLALNELPADAVLYDGFDCVVLGEGSAPLGARQEAALREWVNSGGWLVLRLTPGDGWRRWVQDDAGVAPIEVDAVGKLPLPRELRATISTSTADDGTPVTPAPSVSARNIRLTDEARRNGWIVRWGRADEAEAKAQGPADADTTKDGLLAEGPVGLGMVTVLGVDPRTTSSIVSAKVAREVWREVLSGPMEPAMVRGPEYRGGWNYGQMASGATTEQTAAIGSALDSVATQPRVGIGIFIGIGIGLGLLTLLIGPVDAIGLRFLHLRHRSWLTALGWIALCSIGAYLMPLGFRSGKANVATFSSVDASLRSDGTTALAWRTTAIGVYAQRSARFDLYDPDKPLAGAHWVSGVSSRYSTDDHSVFAPLPLMLGGSAARSCVPVGFQVPQWMFRTLLEETSDATAPLVTADLDMEGQIQVDVRGLPSAARVTLAMVEYKGRRCSMMPLNELEASAARQFSTAKATWQNIPLLKDDPQRDFMLPGADRRGAAMAARRDRGECALVYLWIDGLPVAGSPRVAVGELATAGKATYRLAVPISGRHAHQAGGAP